jgi:hypothetical protein
VIDGEGVHAAAFLPDTVHEGVVGSQVGAAPAVDGLLGIADEEQPGPLVLGALQRQDSDHLALVTVRVLELVDEELVDLAACAPGHVGVVLEQCGRASQQPRERDDAAPTRPLLHLVQQSLKDRARQGEGLEVESGEVREPPGELVRGLAKGVSALAQGLALGPGELVTGPATKRAQRLRVEAVAQPAEELLERLAGVGQQGEPSERRVDRVRDADGLVAAAHLVEAPPGDVAEAGQRIAQPPSGCAHTRFREGVVREYGGWNARLEQRAELRLELARSMPALRERQQGRIARLGIRDAQPALEHVAHQHLLGATQGVDLEVRMQACLEGMGREQPATPGVDRVDDEVVERTAQSDRARAAKVVRRERRRVAPRAQCRRRGLQARAPRAATPLRGSTPRCVPPGWRSCRYPPPPRARAAP